MTSIYNGQFSGNILVVGRTGCGKTTFLEKLGLNNFFGNIIKTEWISAIDIDKQTEAEIQSYFSNKTEVHVAKEQDELYSLIETFKLLSREESNDKDSVNNYFGKNKELHRLIIMNDVSGVCQFPENLAIIAFMFFMQLLLQIKFGKKLFLKLIYLIFFQRVFHTILLPKLFKVTEFYEIKSVFCAFALAK